MLLAGCSFHHQESVAREKSTPRRGPVRWTAPTNAPSEISSYDEVFMNSVQEHWWQLVEECSKYQTGVVVLSFRLHEDGRINDMSVEDNTTLDILGVICQKAVLDLSPYDRWPSPMREMVGREFRKIRLTFSHN